VTTGVRTILAALLGLSLAACATSGSLDMATGEISSRPAVELSDSLVIVDPLAPNWSIKEQALSADRFRLVLRSRSFRHGGDGEAMQIVKRRALQLQREKRYAGFLILDYSEGIESSAPFTHRFSEGTIQLVNALIPPSGTR
jgi:hypothetical protein